MKWNDDKKIRQVDSTLPANQSFARYNDDDDDGTLTAHRENPISIGYTLRTEEKIIKNTCTYLHLHFQSDLGLVGFYLYLFLCDVQIIEL